ncbi:GTP-binding protein SAR1 [Angomonas deanei]|uniref:ADP-ribosylation factor family/Signal recognition particle receptor beta subunit/50S ribosome-binding GTPase/Ras of Complex, Roc, domain of DAPkinase/Ras family, putative n=1 Tax=Angomonas deanei TaxID=59799 RepID=S9VN66_9TRYP|nr:GTP-binding protein SAR1 [Angomonas deanei]EPY42259.1 GTP-binding protein SAR1 [Angomonas deanei]EPY43685.1 GTP-binding protein SAR1 [Angomonas deanei]CAD2221365.1 ADP-ribosylation factor family/Signal recognition particle receptor beta subunit/50S ribosome-binding GTPase/Ras of Complex, Roc, domain of DAPkinase/Ras family, putative [Angomonas deanei]|eukprot:EPY40907.1 GTP-binding protein SAR1 [Angomonas deanei]
MGWFDWARDWLSYFGFSNKSGRILFLGLDNAGKTTLLGKLANDQLHVHRPTFNPNVEELTLGGIRVKTIDMGGHKEARRLWKDYFFKADGIVFLVDAADRERLYEAKNELDLLLQTEEIAKAPFLILGNKIDLPGACGEEELVHVLGLSGLLTGKTTKVKDPSVRPLEVFMTSLVMKMGYGEGFCWLAEYLKNS